MSTIERAINRLQGIPDQAESEAEANGTSVGPTNAVTDTGAPTPDVAAPDETTVKAPPVEAPDAGAPVALASSGAVPDAAPAAPAPAKRQPPIGIDFERFASAGILTPEHAVGRMADEVQLIKRRILGNVVLEQSGRYANLVMVTSALPGEGKTFTSANLVMSIAMELEKTVLAIDTDIAKRDLSRLFGVEHEIGLFDVLAREDVGIADVLRRTSIPNLAVIPVGNDYGASTELLASEAMARVAAELAERYGNRIVILDSPPVLATTSASALAPYAGQLLLVVEAERTMQEAIREALRTLEPCKVTGMLLNKTKWANIAGRYQYGYGYGYGAAQGTAAGAAPAADGGRAGKPRKPGRFRRGARLGKAG